MPMHIPVQLLPFHDNLLDGLDFCKLAYKYLDEILAKPDDGHQLRERRGPIKELIEEILPLCRYVQAHYGPGQYISIQWTGLTKIPDATFTAVGKRVDIGAWPSIGYLEITQAQHPNEYIALEMLNETGGCFGLDGLRKFKDRNGETTYWSEVVSYSNDSHVKTMCEFILNEINAKAIKYSKGQYPDDTSLIVNCHLTTIFAPSEWEQLVMEVRRQARSPFKGIFLVAAGYPYSAAL